MRIAVIGGGYVGLVTGICFARFGNTVTIVERSTERLEALQSGELPIYEPGLDKLFKDNFSRLSFLESISAPKAPRTAYDAIFMCVGTPEGRGGTVDMTAYWAALETVLPALPEKDSSNPFQPPHCLVINKSTVPVGTTAEMDRLLTEHNKRAIGVSNPEFLKEGDAVNDFIRPDRVVVGLPMMALPLRAYAQRTMKDLYRPMVRDENQIYFMRAASSELTKYATNGMLATRISFMNELAQLSEAKGADINEVRRALGADSRIGDQFLYAGLGFGGSCFPKDSKALCDQHPTTMKIVQAALEVNEDVVERVFERIVKAVGDPDDDEKLIAILGTSFKPGTDDLRNAPSLELAKRLLHYGYRVRIADPVSVSKACDLLNYWIEKTGEAGLYGGSHLAEVAHCATTAAMGASCVVLATEWPVYRSLDFDSLREVMVKPYVLVDGRNVWNLATLLDMGFQAMGIGR